MKRKDLTDSEKLEILRLLCKAPKPNQEVVAEQTRHRKEKIGKVLKEFREMDWEGVKEFCGDANEDILRLRPDYIDRRIAEEMELKTKAEEKVARLESEKATIISRLAEQARVTAMYTGEDEFIDPFTGEVMSPLQWLFDLHCKQPC